jgi:hypothetical protein
VSGKKFLLHFWAKNFINTNHALINSQENARLLQVINQQLAFEP